MTQPEKLDYGDPILDRWVCEQTAWCSSYSPDAVRNGQLSWTGEAFICPICKGVMTLERLILVDDS